MRSSFPTMVSHRVSTSSPTPNGHAISDRPGSTASANGHANGSAASKPASPSKSKSKTKSTPQPTPAPAIAQGDVAIDWEVPRKVLHSSIGFLTLYLWLSEGSARPVVVALCAGLAIVVPADVLRLNSPAFERIYERCLGFLMRDSEKHSSNGVIWYMCGAAAVLGAFPLDIATVSILILSWADTAASTFGRLWGRHTPALPRRVPLLRLPLAPRKSTAGFVAATLTGALIALGFWRWLAPLRSGADVSWTFDRGVDFGGAGKRGVGWVETGGWLGLGVISVVAGLTSGIAEALDLGSLDDNLTLPIISGSCLWVFFKLLAYIST